MGSVLAIVAALGFALAAPDVRADEPSQSGNQVEPKQVPPDAAPPEAKKAKYSVDVMIVHATRLRDKKPDQKPVIDQRIGNLPQLREEPFSLYDRFDWLGEEALPLKKGEPESLELPNRRVLRLALLEELAQTVRFSASINRPGGKDFLPLLSVKAQPGKVFIVAGQKYKNGILVLVLRVRK